MVQDTGLLSPPLRAFLPDVQGHVGICVRTERRGKVAPDSVSLGPGPCGSVSGDGQTGLK